MENTVKPAGPPRLTDPVARLLDLWRAGGPRRIVALAGYPGSGKTTAARLWAAEFEHRIGNGGRATDPGGARPAHFVVLGMDGFHRTRAELSAMDDPETAFARRGAPYTFNPASLVGKLKELKAAYGRRPAGWPGFEHGIGDPVENELVVPPECRLLMVEGIYTLYREGEWAELDGLFDELWFLDVPLETAMNRLYRRHQEAWGMSESQARARADGNDRLNCVHIMPARNTADFLVTV